MLGAIIGDVVGSRFEWHNYKGKDFDLFDSKCKMTDDSTLTIAIAKAFLDAKEDYSDLSDLVVKYMREFALENPSAGYGGRFVRWMYSEDPKPYNSYGNGAPMRVSPVGFVANSIEECKELSKKVTEVTHNHPEGLKGAEAISVAIFLARKGKPKEEIKQYMEDNYYWQDVVEVTVQPNLSVIPDSTIHNKAYVCLAGDSNDDGEFGISDVVKLQKYLLASTDMQERQIAASDLTDDGCVDVFDLSLSKRNLIQSR